MRYFRTLLPLACLLLTVPGWSNETMPVFWEQPLQRALQVREDFTRLYDLETPAIRYGLDTASRREEFSRKLHRNPLGTSLWYHFFSGLLGRFSDRDPARQFTNALRLAEDDPGSLWLLYVEFRRFGLVAWCEKTIEKLEKCLLQSGALAAPVIAQQLMMRAATARSAAEGLPAMQRAARFDPHTLSPLLWEARAALTSSPAEVPGALAKTIKKVWGSWWLQLAALSTAIDVLLVSIGILASVLFLVTILPGLPAAVHRFSHVFPLSVSPWLRHAYTLLILFSLGFLGILPMLWLCLLLTWSRLRGREKIIAGICAGVLVAAPFAVHIRTTFRGAQSLASSIGLFRKAHDEGYYRDLYAYALRHQKDNPDDYLAHVTAATLALKRHDPVTARKHVERAEKLRPLDPLVLLTAGNIHYFAQHLERANTYFEKSFELYPEYEATFFNPCLFYFGEMKIMKGIELLENATRINPRKIGAFIEQNDRHFGANWPRIRHFLMPDYKPSYFWFHVFPGAFASWGLTAKAWGMSFLGLGPALYLVLAAVTAVVLHRKSGPGGVRRELPCKICGVPVCRSCMRKQLCTHCAEASAGLLDNAMRRHVQRGLTLKRRRLHFILPGILDAVFPGAGTMHRTNLSAKLRVVPFVLMAASALAYGIYWKALTIQFHYPFRLGAGLVTVAVLPAIGFHAYWLVKSLRKMVHEAKSN